MEPLRVLIADDEPKIRKGMKNSIDWAALGMEVVAEAEDGEVALQKALASRPDLLLVDICMPFLNGLALIGQLREALPESLVIVVTGHDEFTYAQEAVRLRVFDYILKPISHEQLVDVLKSAKEKLSASRRTSEYMRWASGQLEKNRQSIWERFLIEWVEGRLTDAEVKEQLTFFGRDVDAPSGMLLLKPAQTAALTRAQRVPHTAREAVENFLAPSHALVFEDGKGHVAAIVALPPARIWLVFSEKLAAAVEDQLGMAVLAVQTAVDGMEGVPAAYRALLDSIAREDRRTPMVALCKSYIDTHYASEALSLQDAASALGVSPAYLSRLMRQELGASFIDYLIQVRISKAASLLRDPFMRIYDVASTVGYSSQHYFSTAFKKKMGVSPAEYRRDGK